MKNVIIVLGSPNSEKGRLGKLAIGRAKKCIEIFDSNKDFILCTGGFGSHFNKSQKPHFEYLKKYLIKNGISEHFFLPSASSSNTVEDATKSKAILQEFSITNATIITTKYHQKRVQLIFDEIIPNIVKNYVVTGNNLSEKALKKFEIHEEKAIEGILKNGLYY